MAAKNLDEVKVELYTAFNKSMAKATKTFNFGEVYYSDGFIAVKDALQVTTAILAIEREQRKQREASGPVFRPLEGKTP